jgi:hypothetical protein
MMGFDSYLGFVRIYGHFFQSMMFRKVALFPFSGERVQ